MIGCFHTDSIGILFSLEIIYKNATKLQKLRSHGIHREFTGHPRTSAQSSHWCYRA